MHPTAPLDLSYHLSIIYSQQYFYYVCQTTPSMPTFRSFFRTPYSSTIFSQFSSYHLLSKLSPTITLQLFQKYNHSHASILLHSILLLWFCPSLDIILFGILFPLFLNPILISRLTYLSFHLSYSLKFFYHILFYFYPPLLFCPHVCLPLSVSASTPPTPPSAKLVHVQPVSPASDHTRLCAMFGWDRESVWRDDTACCGPSPLRTWQRKMPQRKAPHT